MVKQIVSFGKLGSYLKAHSDMLQSTVELQWDTVLLLR